MNIPLERTWDKRVEKWHSHVTSAAAFEKVLDHLLRLAAPREADECVDLGAGTGFVTTALAPRVSSVLAVDISAAMAASLLQRATAAGLANVSAEVAEPRPAGSSPGTRQPGRLQLRAAPPHGPDEKRDLVARAAQWLRPDGRLVIADMTFCWRKKWGPADPVGEGGRAGRQGTGRVSGGGSPRTWAATGWVRPGAPGDAEFWLAALRQAGFTRRSSRSWPRPGLSGATGRPGECTVPARPGPAAGPVPRR